MSDDDLTPQELQVRRLLADARHTEPMPADVAERLNRALAELGDEPVPNPAPGSRPVTDLAARRRRRSALTLLAAAAAVVVVGVGIRQLDTVTMSSDDADSGAAADNSDSGSVPEVAPEAADEELSASAFASLSARLSSTAFERQVRRLVTDRNALKSYEYDTPSTVPGEDATAASRADALQRYGCVPEGLGSGFRIPVVYDGEKGFLLVHPVSGGVRVVDLYYCGGSEPARTTRVPVG